MLNAKERDSYLYLPFLYANRHFTPKQVNSMVRTAKKDSTQSKTIPRKNLGFALKVIRWTKSDKSFLTFCKYILKHTPNLENDFGSTIKEQDIKKELERFDLLNDKENSKSRRQLCHFIVSLPSRRVNRRSFEFAMHETLSELCPHHKYVIGIHSNTENMHCHVVMKARNDFTDRQLSINPKELSQMHSVFAKNFIECKVLENPAKTPRKRVIFKKKPTKNKSHKVLSTAYSKVPKWKEMFQTDIFPYITANEATLEKLKKLGMEEKQVVSFLKLYEEDKRLAVWSLNNNSKLFGIKKPKEAVTLRKVTLAKEKAKEQTKIQSPQTKSTNHGK